MKLPTSRVTALCMLLLLSACNDSSDTSIFADGEVPGGSANGDLSGELVISLFRETDDYPKNTVLEFDLRSGQYTELSGNVSLEAN